jgi:pentatricopeptide repeat protein
LLQSHQEKMFSCRSCMRRHVRTLLGDSALHQVEQRSANIPHQTLGSVRRSYSATALLCRSGPRAIQQWSKLQSQPLPTPAAVRKELLYLLDPLKLANHVLNLLQGRKFDEACKLVREASKSFSCAVSWNHLIDSQLKEGKVNGAIKTYNEVCDSLCSTSPMTCQY